MVFKTRILHITLNSNIYECHYFQTVSKYQEWSGYMFSDFIALYQTGPSFYRKESINYSRNKEGKSWIASTKRWNDIGSHLAVQCIHGNRCVFVTFVSERALSNVSIVDGSVMNNVFFQWCTHRHTGMTVSWEIVKM